MAGPLVLKNGNARQALSLVAFLGTLVVFGLGFRAGEAGGKLVYEHGAAQVYVTGDAGAGPVEGGNAAEDGDSDGD
jgi:hypothetical protein